MLIRLEPFAQLLAQPEASGSTEATSLAIPAPAEVEVRVDSLTRPQVQREKPSEVQTQRLWSLVSVTLQARIEMILEEGREAKYTVFNTWREPLQNQFLEAWAECATLIEVRPDPPEAILLRTALFLNWITKLIRHAGFKPDASMALTLEQFWERLELLGNCMKI